MKNLIIGTIIMANFILHTTLFHNFKLFGVIPNTALVLVVTFSIHYGKSKGAVIGFLMGIIQDILFGRVVGMNALAYMLIGYFVGMMTHKIIMEKLVVPFLLVALSTLLNALINLLFIYFLGFRTEVFLLFKDIIIVEMPYNAFLSVPIYVYVSKIIDSKLMQKRGY
ncbi:MAG: rod shape-determining protein MreD [Clostridiales bacterium]|nr:rod shape-determining protein MreD [Clostridiales bacterium]